MLENLLTNLHIGTHKKTVKNLNTAASLNLPLNYRPYPTIGVMPLSQAHFEFINFSTLKKPADKKMFNDIVTFLGNEDSSNLETLVINGKLLAKKSADGSSTLQNLYGIMTEPTITGLDTRKILKDTIDELANPCLITQKFGKIPDLMAPAILANEKRTKLANEMGLNPNLAPHFNQTQVTGPFYAVNPKDLNVEGGTCAAASIEFDLADKNPAEFARYVREVKRPDSCVKTPVKLKNLDPNPIKAIGILNEFKVDYKYLNYDTVEVALRPDKNAIVRDVAEAAIQQPKKRTEIDTLLQSMFMQLGSSNRYNSLMDKRGVSDPTQDVEGLIDTEKDLVESVVNIENKKKKTVVYQNIDKNDYLVGYNCDFKTMENHLVETLNKGSHILTGITFTDQNRKITGGHQLTVTGTRVDEKGERYFIINDTDDKYPGLVELKAQTLLPMLGDAQILEEVLNSNSAKNILPAGNIAA